MEFTTYQNFERRNAQDQIIRAGTWGKNTALANAQNTGILDYVGNNLDWLYANKVGTAVTINGHALSSNITVTKSDVGLGSVDYVKQVAYAQGAPNANKVFATDASGNQTLTTPLTLEEIEASSSLVGKIPSAGAFALHYWGIPNSYTPPDRPVKVWMRGDVVSIAIYGIVNAETGTFISICDLPSEVWSSYLHCWDFSVGGITIRLRARHDLTMFIYQPSGSFYTNENFLATLTYVR